MAKKNDRKEYNKLKKKKADNKKQQEQCQSEIDVLDEKIERLKAAYRKLDDAKEAIDDIKHNQRNMINSDLYQCMWTGSNAQECYESCESGNLYTPYFSFIFSFSVFISQLMASSAASIFDTYPSYAVYKFPLSHES